MAEFTAKDLRNARESRKIKRWELAGELGVSEDTIRRWETSSQRPDPDDVGNIERVLKAPGLWHKWMLSNYDSYRERYTGIPDLERMTEVVVRMRHELSDVMPLFEEIERDSLNGKIDKPELWKIFRRESLEAMAAMQQAVDRIPNEL